MTLLLYDDIYLKHDTAPYHPENYKRLECTIDHLKSAGLWNKLTLVSPRAATVEEIALVHDRGYISRARKVAEGGGGQLDPDGAWDSASLTMPQSPHNTLYPDTNSSAC